MRSQLDRVLASSRCFLSLWNYFSARKKLNCLHPNFCWIFWLRRPGQLRTFTEMKKPSAQPATDDWSTEKLGILHEKTSRSLHCRPGDTFRLKNVNSAGGLAPCSNLQTFMLSPLLQKEAVISISALSQLLWWKFDVLLEQESHLEIEVRNKWKIYGVCIMKSVAEGLLFLFLGQVCTWSGEKPG